MPSRRSPLLLPVAIFLATACAAPAADSRTWSEDLIRPVTSTAVNKLPAADRAPWQAYLAESAKRKAARAGIPVEAAPKSAAKSAVRSSALRLNGTADYYASTEAVTLANNILTWQLPEGGWLKGGDYSKTRPAGAGLPKGTWAFATFDNKSTTPELRFLALVANALGDKPEAKPLRTGVARAIGYIFAAQYPNGGFPQIYPLVGDYHDAITFNDGAMINVLNVLRDLAAPTPEFAFVPAQFRTEAAARLKLAVDCVLATQVKIDGALTIWPQQAEAFTLAPAPGRAFEPVSLCAAESAGIVEFLKKLPATPEITASIDAALAWFEAHAQHDVAWQKEGDEAPRLVPAPGAPALWARYYDLKTQKPIFGDRDNLILDDVNLVSAERRAGYSWYGTYAAKLLKKPSAK